MPATMAEEGRSDRTWLRSFEFADMEKAGTAYKGVRDIVFGQNIDASVYRVQIRGVPHVVIIGEGDLAEEMLNNIEQACAAGRTVSIPPEISSTLRERRIAGKLPGAFWEGNYRPGIVVPNRRARRRAG